MQKHTGMCTKASLLLRHTPLEAVTPPALPRTTVGISPAPIPEALTDASANLAIAHFGTTLAILIATRIYQTTALNVDVSGALGADRRIISMARIKTKRNLPIKADWWCVLEIARRLACQPTGKGIRPCVILDNKAAHCLLRQKTRTRYIQSRSSPRPVRVARRQRRQRVHLNCQNACGAIVGWFDRANLVLKGVDSNKGKAGLIRKRPVGKQDQHPVLRPVLTSVGNHQVARNVGNVVGKNASFRDCQQGSLLSSIAIIGYRWHRTYGNADLGFRTRCLPNRVARRVNEGIFSNESRTWTVGYSSTRKEL